MILAADTFTRANGDPGNSWTAIPIVGSWSGNKLQILSDQLNPVASQDAMYWNAATFPADQWAQVTISTLSDTLGENRGLILRAGAAGTAYLAFGKSGSGYFLYKVIAGAFTLITGPIGTVVLNDVLYASAVGTAITVKVNGTAIISTTDSAVVSGASGVYGGSTASTFLINNFQAGNFITVNTPGFVIDQMAAIYGLQRL